MAWEKFVGASAVRVNYGDSIKAYVNKRKDGSFTLTITMNELIASNLVYREKCDVYLGTDNDEGKMQLQFHENGEVAPTRLAKGGIRLTLTAPRFCPKMSKPADACIILDKNEKSVTFSLPLAAWGRPPKEAQPTEPVYNGGHSNPPLAPSPLTTLDPIPYLKKKGHEVARRGVMGYAVDGERKTHSDIVAMINRHRDKEGLPALGMDQVLGG